MHDVVGDVLAAIDRRDWTALQPLLHPYLHWRDGHGPAIRGRAKVLAHLARHPHVAQPSSVELRDGQVYRWRSEPP